MKNNIFTWSIGGQRMDKVCKVLKFVLVVTTALGALALSGCTSIPAPESPNDTLVIVDVFREAQSPGELFGQIEITITSKNDPTISHTLKLEPAKEYEVFQGIEPGVYTVENVVFEYEKTNDPHQLDKPAMADFRVKEGTMTILPWQAWYLTKQTGMTVSFRKMPEEQYSSLLEQLREEEEFGSWELLRAEADSLIILTS